MEDADEEAILFFQEMGDISGVERLVTTIYAIAYLEPEEISLEDLARRSGYSLSTVSVKADMLARLGLVKKIRKAGTHKVFIFADKDICRVIRESIVEKQRKKFALSREKMPSIMEKYRKKGAGERERQKLLLLENYYAATLKFEKAFERMMSEFDKGRCNGCKK